jgi:hypothetical protein
MLQGHTSSRVYCIIDGLDVYREGMDGLISKLSEVFSRRIEAESPVLKLLCTSRPEGPILDLWGPSIHRILRCNPRNLNIFINSRVRSLGKRFTDDMKETIETQLHMQAEGTFLWLEVVIRRIRSIKLPTVNKIEETIKNSPRDLDELYNPIVHRLVQGDRDNARLLAWVVYTQCPLDLKALGDAMAINPAKNYISYEQCLRDKPRLVSAEVYKFFSTLLDITEGKVYLIHQSAKDYFERQNPL